MALVEKRVANVPRSDEFVSCFRAVNNIRAIVNSCAFPIKSQVSSERLFWKRMAKIQRATSTRRVPTGRNSKEYDDEQWRIDIGDQR